MSISSKHSERRKSKFLSDTLPERVKLPHGIWIGNGNVKHFAASSEADKTKESKESKPSTLISFFPAVFYAETLSKSPKNLAG